MLINYSILILQMFRCEIMMCKYQRAEQSVNKSTAAIGRVTVSSICLISDWNAAKDNYIIMSVLYIYIYIYIYILSKITQSLSEVVLKMLSSFTLAKNNSFIYNF